MKEPTSINILIIDDHPVVREGIKTLLAASSPAYRYFEAADGSEAMRTVKTQRMDIVIVDLEIPGIDGFQLIEALAQRPFPPRVVVYTMHEEPWTVAQLQEACVSAVVLKGDDPHEIITAVESAQARLPITADATHRSQKRPRLCSRHERRRFSPALQRLFVAPSSRTALRQREYHRVSLQADTPPPREHATTCMPPPLPFREVLCLHSLTARRSKEFYLSMALRPCIIHTFISLAPRWFQA